jgi:hypothetical protein
MVIAITLDGYKISNATGTGTGTIGAGATGDVSVTLSSTELAKINHVLGVKQITVTGATVYLVAFAASGNTVTVTLYNPGTAAASVTVSVTATVVGN